MWRVLLAYLAGFWILAPRMAGATSSSPEEARRYVLIVANNSSLEEGVASLSYADDDGAKYFELFRGAGAEVKLLTVLDPTAQRRYAEAARVAVSPTRYELTQALDSFFARIRADREAGRETHFVFVYAGHGNMGPNREGYLNLVDGPLRRSDLYRDVLARSPATFNHLILDACHAYFLVQKRGGSDKVGDYRSAVREFLGTEELDHYPNTGVILASSAEAETQEWSRWESGIFSHELRSALVGGADVNGDGNISYAEAAAFVEAANSAVDIPRARLRVFYRPPPIRTDVPMLQMSAFRNAPVLVVDAERAGRYHVEDNRGVRIADIHSSRDHAARLALLGAAPFFLRDADREASITGQRTVTVSELSFLPRAERTRGGIEATFRKHLFEVAFGPGFFQGIASAGSDLDRAVNAGPALPEERPGSERPGKHPLRPWTLATASAAVAVGVAGGVTYALAAKAHDEYERATTKESAASLRETSEERLTTARLLFGAAGVMAAATATLFVIDQMGAASKARGSTQLSAGFSPGPGAAGLFLSGRW